MSEKPAKSPVDWGSRNLSKNERMQRLQWENDRLKRLLAQTNGEEPIIDPDLEVDERNAGVFDARIVSELVNVEGRTVQAFDRIGYALSMRSGEEKERVVRRVLSRPGVVRLLTKRWGELESHRDPIIARMARIARYTPNEETAISAATWLAKMGGWFAAEKKQVLVGSANAFASMQKVLDEMRKLNHEPGDAVAIDDTEKPTRR